MNPLDIYPAGVYDKDTPRGYMEGGVRMEQEKTCCGGKKTERTEAERSDLAVYEAVRGMLPKNSLGRAMAKKLRVYKGPEHTHAAQKPEQLKLD